METSRLRKPFLKHKFSRRDCCTHCAAFAASNDAKLIQAGALKDFFKRIRHTKLPPHEYIGKQTCCGDCMRRWHRDYMRERREVFKRLD